MRVPLFLLLLLLLPPGGSAQFPRACAQLAALRSRTCCPVWEGDGSPCGERSGRGRCRASRGPGVGGRDFRLGWPTSFYGRTCACRGRFSGFDCGECRDGYRGSDCRRWVLTVRRGLHEMDRAQRRRLVDYLARAKATVSPRYVVLISRNASDVGSYRFRDASVYDVCTWVHYVAAKPISTRRRPNFAHMGPAFAVWHRRYLLFFEKEIRHLTSDEDFHLPYWDWTRAAACDICTDELMGANDEDGYLLPPSPFASWRVRSRPSTPPTKPQPRLPPKHKPLPDSAFPPYLPERPSLTAWRPQSTGPSPVAIEWNESQGWHP
ncbi:tyrosinase-like [Carcharodon carcharias]|uniref:tyrosinase-like n=1 Tax=Carcharodon carcharias TaxID=13397 RepID=UPI001B7EB04C|nr:tyrosinase-like [Carcharodon carcharias]